MNYPRKVLLLLVFALMAANVGYAQDCTITTTGGNLVITDNSDNGDLLTMTQDDANIRFVYLY